ncbi:MAG: 50S ribosomal protein L10 [Acidobacteria bacterium]|nr:50S ribosomal protein L10 [Acidobacteriota bacterium]
MLTREQKRTLAAEIREQISAVNTLFIMENTGLTVNEVNELRARIREVDGAYRVIKNNIVRMAVEGTSLSELTEHLRGPNAFAFTNSDGIALAKTLRDFTKTHPELRFKEAFLEGQILSADRAAQLAEMPTREELLTKLAYLLQSPMRRLVVALNGPVQKLATALHHVAEKKES